MQISNCHTQACLENTAPTLLGQMMAGGTVGLLTASQGGIEMHE